MAEVQVYAQVPMAEYRRLTESDEALEKLCYYFKRCLEPDASLQELVAYTSRLVDWCNHGRDVLENPDNITGRDIREHLCKLFGLQLREDR